MRQNHPLSGLMAFAGQSEWRDLFSQLLGKHLRTTLDAFGLPSDTLIKLLGKQRTATLWGCVLEDLTTCQAGAEGRNILDDYLTTAGKAEPRVNQAYMLSLRASVMSLYEIVEVIPAATLMVRDAVREKAPVALHRDERMRHWSVGDWVAMRLLSAGEAHLATGGLLRLTPQSANTVLEELHNIAAKLGLRIKDIDDIALRQCTPVLTQAWLLENLPLPLTPAVETAQC